MSIAYEKDIIAWANEQAGYIRAGRFDLVDAEHLAEEIETMGKSEKRALASSMLVLLMHLLKWQYQPDRRSASWNQSIKVQRDEIQYDLKDIPSLKTLFKDEEWQKIVWRKARLEASKETGLGLNVFPDDCPWSMTDVLKDDWLPE
ncbi:MAG TPA: DUF29 domain-containing protein [Aquirhabdus sp.]